MENHIVLALVFLAAVIASRSVFSLVTGVVGRDKAPPPVLDKRPAPFRIFSGQIDTCGNTVEALSAGAFHKQTQAVRELLVSNGLEDVIQPRDVIGMQGFAALSCSIAGALLLFIVTQSALASVAACAVAGTIGWIYPRSWLAGRLKKRKEQIARDLPYCIDLLTVAMRAGQDFGAALRNLVREAPDGPLVIEFERLLKQISLGSSRTEALQRFADRVTFIVIFTPIVIRMMNTLSSI